MEDQGDSPGVKWWATAAVLYLAGVIIAQWFRCSGQGLY